MIEKIEEYLVDLALSMFVSRQQPAVPQQQGATCTQHKVWLFLAEAPDAKLIHLRPALDI
jgi:hypothetical protein